MPSSELRFSGDAVAVASPARCVCGHERISHDDACGEILPDDPALGQMSMWDYCPCEGFDRRSDA